MKIKMPSGVILECNNEFINQSRLNQGGVEVIDKPIVQDEPIKKVTKRKINK